MQHTGPTNDKGSVWSGLDGLGLPPTLTGMICFGYVLHRPRHSIMALLQPTTLRLRDATAAQYWPHPHREQRYVHAVVVNGDFCVLIFAAHNIPSLLSLNCRYPANHAVQDRIAPLRKLPEGIVGGKTRPEKLHTPCLNMQPRECTLRKHRTVSRPFALHPGVPACYTFLFLPAPLV